MNNRSDRKVAIKPKWLIKEEAEGNENNERGNRTENFYMLKLLLKITEQYKKKNMPASDYSIKHIGTDSTRPKYLSKMKKLKWLEWVDGPEPNDKKSGWAPTSKGKNVLKIIVKLQSTDPQSPLLELEAFQELDYIDKGLLEK